MAIFFETSPWYEDLETIFRLSKLFIKREIETVCDLKEELWNPPVIKV